MTFPILTDQREPTAATFATPGEGRGFVANLFSAPADIWNDPAKYGAIVSAADRSTMLTGTITSESVAREEAYDRRIAAIKAKAGIELENPERGGYSRDARKAIRDEMRDGGLHTIDDQGGIPAFQRKLFDQRLAEIQQKHPDLTFGDLDEEAKTIAKGAIKNAEAAVETANPVAAMGASFVGGMTGMRRDPLFIGSLFAGPTYAAGRTALARVASSAFVQGLFNAGVSAAEQPQVQSWRGRIGLESGIVPAVEDVGLAFLMGMIPGAAIQGVKEAVSPMKRLMAGAPEAGDSAKVSAAIGQPETPELASALRAGEEAVSADRAILSEPAAKDVSPELHDDMMGAALKRADDPEAASPEAVAAVKGIQAFHGSPHDFSTFNLSKIGTGEGAQSFGHGLYFAENPKVAENYNKKLQYKAFEDKVKEIYEEGDSPTEAFNMMKAEKSSFKPEEWALVKALEKDDFLGFDYPHQAVRAALSKDAAARWEMSPETIAAADKLKEGNLYQVSIKADKADFMDWDRPISEQPAKVRAAIEQNIGFWPDDADTLTVNNLIQDMVTEGKLKEAGVPGIKYLDEGSRPTPHLEGELWKVGDAAFKTKADAFEYAKNNATHNFVVFDDKLIEITHKNDKPTAQQSELAARIEEAQPKTEREAQAAADEALDDFGNRDVIAKLRETMDAERVAAGEARTARLAEPESTKVQRGDPMGKVPFVREDGTPVMMTQKAIAAIGEREDTLSMLVRSCK